MAVTGVALGWMAQVQSAPDAILRLPCGTLQELGLQDLQGDWVMGQVRESFRWQAHCSCMGVGQVGQGSSIHWQVCELVLEGGGLGWAKQTLAH